MNKAQKQFLEDLKNAENPHEVSALIYEQMNRSFMNKMCNFDAYLKKNGYLKIRKKFHEIVIEIVS